MSSYNDYETLVDTILSSEDRLKFEAALGAVISGGPRVNVVIQGAGGTGKSTLLDIVEKITERASGRGVYIRRDGFASPRRGHYVFSETNTFVSKEIPNLVLIATTGKTVPEETHKQIVQSILEYPGLIALRCVDRYITATRNNQEN